MIPNTHLFLLNGDNKPDMLDHSFGDVDQEPKLLDHQPLKLNEDDYACVCKIPKRKVNLFLGNKNIYADLYNILWLC